MMNLPPNPVSADVDVQLLDLQNPNSVILPINETLSMKIGFIRYNYSVDKSIFNSL